WIRNVPAMSWAVAGRATARNKPIETMGEAFARMARSYPLPGLTADRLVRRGVVAVVGCFVGGGHGSGGTGDHAGGGSSAGAAGSADRGGCDTGCGCRRNAADGVHAGGEVGHHAVAEGHRGATAFGH